MLLSAGSFALGLAALLAFPDLRQALDGILMTSRMNPWVFRLSQAARTMMFSTMLLMFFGMPLGGPLEESPHASKPTPSSSEASVRDVLDQAERVAALWSLGLDPLCIAPKMI